MSSRKNEIKRQGNECDVGKIGEVGVDCTLLSYSNKHTGSQRIWGPRGVYTCEDDVDYYRRDTIDSY